MTTEQISKIAQEQNLPYDFVELYFEEFEKIFRKNFCFTDKEIAKSIEQIFKSKDEEAVEYFFDIFQKYASLQASSKTLTDDEKISRRQLAERIVSKAVDLYQKGSRKIKNEFFDALKEAESYGIDPYRISNKTTFRGLTVDAFQKSLKALVEETYVDLNTEKDFKLFEDMDDVKAMFEECSSVACKFNADTIQDVLGLLSNFTYDKEHKVFYGNVNYVNMVRKSKQILIQPLSRLEETMEFLEKNFTDPKDPSSKAELVKKIDENPTILLLSPDKVLAFEKKLVSLGLSQERAKSFCFNKDNLIQINGISEENMSNLGLVKTVLGQYLDSESVLDALTRFEYIKTSPVLLDVIFKRAIEEGVYADLLKRPSALANFGGESGVYPSNTGDNRGSRRKNGLSLKPLEERQALSDEEKETLQKQMAKISAKDKEFVESVIDKLKGKEEDDGNKRLIDPRNDKTTISKPHGQDKSNTKKPRRSKYIDDQLLEKIAKIEAQEDVFPVFKVLDIAEAFLDKVNGAGYCHRAYRSDELRKNLERQYNCEMITQTLIETEDLFKPFAEIIAHLEHLTQDPFPVYMTEDNAIRDYIIPDSILHSMAVAETIGEEMEGVSNLSNQISRYNDRIESSRYRGPKSSVFKGGKVKFEYNQVFFNEANLNSSVLEMAYEVKKVLKNHFDEVLKPELMSQLHNAVFNPKMAIATFNVIKQIIAVSEAEKAAYKAGAYGEDGMNGKETASFKPVNPGRTGYLNSDIILPDQDYLKHQAVKCCILSMRDNKTKRSKLDRKFNSSYFDITSVEYDDEGVFLRFKKGFTLYYPAAPTQEWVDKLRMQPATEGTKELPRITMTQNRVFDDLSKMDSKIFN